MVGFPFLKKKKKDCISGRKGLFRLTVPNHSPTSKEIRTENQGRYLEAAIYAELMEEVLFAGLLSIPHYCLPRSATTTNELEPHK